MALKESTYLCDLRISSPDAASRYLEKIKAINCDPYIVSESDFDYGLEFVPPITCMDIITYVVLIHSFYSNEQMRAYKSLAAYKYFEAGFVEKVGFRNINNLVLLIGKVQHSMKAREGKLKVWFIAEKNGSICTGHCSCMAGLGEVCSHITAVLYAAEHAANLKKNASCTDVKAAWPVPSQGGTQPMEVASMDWGKIVKEKNVVECPPMSNSEMRNMLLECQNSNCQAALMRIIEPFASQITKESVRLPVFFNIYHKKHEKKTLEDLILLGRNVNMVVTENMATEIETRTEGQRNSEEWYRQRVGRITSSIFKNVCSTNVEKPSLSVIKLICYPQKILTKAIKWGIEHEELAINAYYKRVNVNHENFILNKVGLVVSTTWPQLGVSPDGLVYCDCCAGGCLEVKCPFSLREARNLRDFAEQKYSCLDCNENGLVHINKNHHYYYQVQAQIFISNLLYCDFVVWCPNFMFIERVSPDFEFWEGTIIKVLKFHAEVIMPELLGRYYTSKAPGGNITKWCFCNSIDDGQPMVQCCYDNCDISFFHVKCVNLLEKPHTIWACSVCNKKMCHDY